MKALVITTVRFRQNGITSVIMNYYRNLNSDQVHMDFVGPNKIDAIYQKEFDSTRSVYTQLSSRKRNLIKYMYNLYVLIKKGNYDIVHVHGSSHLIVIELVIAKFAGVNVRIAHSHSTRCDHEVLHKFFSPLFDVAYTKGIACNISAGQWMFGEKDFTVIKNGINIDKFKFRENIRFECREALNLSKEDIVIGHVGGFITVKNHEFIIDLAEKLIEKNKKYKFLLIGDGQLMTHINEMISEKNLINNIILLGNRKDVELYYNSMDLFILPSLYEGQPVVLIEAQANGLNLIVSDTIAKDNSITDEIYYLELDNNFSQWIDTIEDKIQVNITDRRQLSESNCRILTDQGYNVISNCDDLLELYSKEIMRINGEK